MYTILSIIGALGAGMCASHAAYVQQYVINIGGTIEQSYYDSDFIAFLVFFSAFITVYLQNSTFY